MVVVTDVNEDRLARAEALFPPAEVKEKDGIDLHFVNTGKMENPAAELREMTGDTGFDMYSATRRLRRLSSFAAPCSAAMAV